MVVPATTSIHNQSWNMNHIVFLLPFLFTQSTTLLLANGFIIHRFPQKPQTSFLSLFSIQSIKNGNNDGNGNDDVSTNSQRNSNTNNKNVTSQEDDFSAWIDGLKQWPLVPSKESEPSVSLTLTSSRYRGSNPFLNIVQLMETLDQEKSIFSIADQLFRNLVETTGFVPSLQNTTTTTVQDLLDSKEWLPIQNSPFLDDPTRNASAIQTAYNYSAWEGILKEATARMEYLVQEASLAPSVLPELIERTSQLFSFSSNSADPSINFLNTTAVESLPEERRQLLQASTNYAANFMTVANTVFTAGYAAPSGSVLSTTLSEQRPLFADFPSAQRITRDQQFDVVRKGAEMGSLAGAIYEDTLARCQGLGHAMIAQGTTSDVAWMVTDSSEDSAWTRTITIRGFDASDDTVDRERLLNAICTPQPELMEGVMFHSGLLTTARAIYPEVIKYLDWSSPQQKIVLNGHSIGGSLAVLVLLLLTAERGADYVQDKVRRVYTHGSPPVAVVKIARRSQSIYECPILREFNLPSDLVYGYIQPYDPIVRFMTKYDPLYPLVDDLGSDEKTLYVSGPRRSLRPITRVILSNWDGWPQFRDNWKQTNQIYYQSVGIQHLLLPDPQRYLSDRFVSPNVGVPPTDQIVRISSTELLDALNAAFPLDTFQISLIPQAIRSFLHHFYPAYDSSIANYAVRSSKDLERSPKRNMTPQQQLDSR